MQDEDPSLADTKDDVFVSTLQLLLGRYGCYYHKSPFNQEKIYLGMEGQDCVHRELDHSFEVFHFRFIGGQAL